MNRNKPYCTDITWLGRADCRHCAIRGTVLFSDLPEAELDGRLMAIDNLWLEEGAELFAQGGAADAVFTIRSGNVKIVHELENGSNRIVRMHYPGDALGLEAILGEAYRHSAVALQALNVCSIPVAVLKELDLSSPQIYRQLLARWQLCLDEADSVITELNTGHAEARVARLLIKLAAHGDERRIPSLPREDIGAIIGVSTETASRIMADFRRRKLIWNASQKELGCDREALAALLEKQKADR